MARAYVGTTALDLDDLDLTGVATRSTTCASRPVCPGSADCRSRTEPPTSARYRRRCGPTRLTYPRCSLVPARGRRRSDHPLGPPPRRPAPPGLRHPRFGGWRQPDGPSGPAAHARGLRPARRGGGVHGRRPGGQPVLPGGGPTWWRSVPEPSAARWARTRALSLPPGSGDAPPPMTGFTPRRRGPAARRRRSGCAASAGDRQRVMCLSSGGG